MRIVASLLIGLVMGLVGGFVQTWVLPVAGFTIPSGMILVLATAVPVARAVAWWQGSRWGALAFLVGWVAATFALGITTPSGDLVLDDSPWQLAYLIGSTALLASAASFPLIERPDPAPLLEAPADA